MTDKLKAKARKELNNPDLIFASHNFGDFVNLYIDKARQEERDSWLYQKANEHDKRIRQDERAKHQSEVNNPYPPNTLESHNWIRATHAERARCAKIARDYFNPDEYPDKYGEAIAVTIEKQCLIRLR